METILKAKQGDANAMNDICTEYKGLVKSIASKFYLVGGDNEDLLQEGMIGLFKAVGNYDPNKGAFPSFVKICVLRQIIGVVKRANDNKNRSLINYVELSQIHDLAQIGGSPLDVLIEKTVQAAKELGVDTVTAGGGVAANGYLREGLYSACRKNGLKLVLPEKRYCTDNAAMIAAEGLVQYRLGNFADLSLNAKASIPLAATLETVQSRAAKKRVEEQ